MRIGLNLLHARPEIGGGWNYIENVVKSLTLLDLDCEFVAYCTAVSSAIIPNDRRFRTKMVHLSTSSQFARVAYEQCLLPMMAYRDRVDCMHWFANNRSIVSLVPSVVTVHDLKSIDRPFEGSFSKRLYWRGTVRFACRHADTLAPVSETTAEAAIRLLGVDRKRIFVVPNPIDGLFGPVASEDIQDFRERFNLPPQFWLYVAHPYPHKNHTRLFAAYKKFRDAGNWNWPLLLRGDCAQGMGTLGQEASELGIAESVIWLPRLPNKDMATLYSAATALIFPSLYEGCGIPLLEAMACGCPVAGSDIATTREFAGDAALLFDATNVDAIEGAMRQFAESAALREAYATKGHAKVEEYSPGNVASKLLAAYQNAVPCRTPMVKKSLDRS